MTKYVVLVPQPNGQVNIQEDADVAAVHPSGALLFWGPKKDDGDRPLLSAYGAGRWAYFTEAPDGIEEPKIVKPEPRLIQ